MSNLPTPGVSAVSHGQFSTPSTVAGMPPLAIAGSISVSGSWGSGANLRALAAHLPVNRVTLMDHPV